MTQPGMLQARGLRLPSKAVTRAVAMLLLAAASSSLAAPAEGGLSFLVVGDWGRAGNFHQRDVAEQMGRVAAEMTAAFVVTTGDNLYENGVTSITSPEWQESFERIYTAPSLQIPWYPVLGNHDHRSNPSAQVEYSKVSSRWKLPARYHSKRFQVPGGGSVEFFFLDTQPLVKKPQFVEAYRKSGGDPDAARHTRNAQLEWLSAALAASTAEWKIAVGHHPVFSEGSAHGNTPELIRDLKPLLERHGVQAYMSGHDHDLQHIVVNDVNYITSGAGSRTRPTGTGPNTRFSLGNTSGFLAVRLASEEFSGRFVDWTGKVVYSFGFAPREAARQIPVKR